jgi:PAS domain S-box-containing protein
VFAIPLTGDDSCFACMDIDLTDYRDLQERNRAEETLRALVFSSVTDAIFYMSVQPGGEFRYVSVNPAFQAAAGLSSEHIIGKLVDDVIAPPRLTTMRLKFDEAIRSGRPVSWEEVWASQAGERHGEATVTPIVDEGGRCTNLLCTVHDVTTRVQAESERRALEVQLHQAQRMQSLGTLAGGIAHDFNNILTAITGYADLAKDELPPDAEAHESVAAIRKASERASEVVRQILTFSRQDAPKRQPVALDEIIDETVTLLRATLPGLVRINTHIAKGVPFVLADATQVHQALMNLGTNAAHAVDAKGTIDVTLETVAVDSHMVATLPDLAEGRYVILSVADTGRGMDQVTRARVFEPFFTTKAAGQGTGLGMSVVHGIMKSHHGTVTVESELGQGATFRLYFPAHEAAIEERPVTVTEVPAGRNQHILYVDDEEALVFLTSRMLRRLGYRVTGYTDAAVALQAFRSGPGEFDVLMTDTSMPGLSGVDLVREILQVRRDIPVVMVSGYMQPADLDSVRQLGVTEIVLKPHSPRDLGAALQRVISPA